MSLLGRIFGTEKSLNTAVGAVVKGLDALKYTDEEKATDMYSERSEARKMVVSWMTATSGQNLARRALAMGIGFTWLGSYIASMLMGIASVFMNKQDGKIVETVHGTVVILSQSEQLNEVSELVRAGANDMSPAVMLVLTFYFAAPHMGSVVQTIVQNFQKNHTNEDKKDGGHKKDD